MFAPNRINLALLCAALTINLGSGLAHPPGRLRLNLFVTRSPALEIPLCDMLLSYLPPVAIMLLLIVLLAPVLKTATSLPTRTMYCDWENDPIFAMRTER